MRTGFLVVLLLCFAPGGRAEQEAARPNILFVLIDDLRWNALGCMGHPFAKSPHIDRIGREGAIFQNAFVTTPLCSPSRASYLTGRYVRANGIKGNGNNNEASHKLVTWPLLLQKAGYVTAYMGKWHMGNDDSPRPGFDRWVSFKGQGAHVDPAINVDGQAGKVQGYMTDILTDHAVEFLKRPHAKPFALYLAHKAVHGPFTPADRHKDLFADQKIERSPNAKDTLEGKPALRREQPNPAPAARQAGAGDELVRNQLRMLVAIDEGMGRILKALEEKGKLDSTLIVFTSDNGFFWGDHGLGDKRAAYEESLRVPLLVRYPALVKAGSRPEAMALNVDIAPTMLELAGAPIPGDMHGRSLVPVLKGDAGRTSFLAEYYLESRFARIPTWEAVRTDRWKYIRYPELTGMDELYDLRADPYELKNLIADSSAQPALKGLKEDLTRLASAIR